MQQNQQEAIVQRAKGLPELTRIEIGTPQKERGFFRFEVNLGAEASLDGGHIKRGVAQPNAPGYGAFQLICDEGKMIGGEDTAPAPLSYLAAGIAFCFLSHISIYIHAKQLNVRSARVEQKMRFKAAALVMAETSDTRPKGECDGIEIFVFIDSDETRETIMEMIKSCEAACMGLQTAVNSVTARINLVQAA
ncbi:OsmC-related (seleno)protein [Ruegeria hyattellae]|uniref:OsmC-related (seleno)protein n=1 Tax=Ruegeria hyattellae TaxID=3233337 RepID=UPI00355B55DE